MLNISNPLGSINGWFCEGEELLAPRTGIRRLYQIGDIMELGGKVLRSVTLGQKATVRNISDSPNYLATWNILDSATYILYVYTYITLATSVNMVISWSGNMIIISSHEEYHVGQVCIWIS